MSVTNECNKTLSRLTGLVGAGVNCLCSERVHGVDEVCVGRGGRGGDERIVPEKLSCVFSSF